MSQKEVTLKERLEVRKTTLQFRKGAIQDEERATEGRQRRESVQRAEGEGRGKARASHRRVI